MSLSSLSIRRAITFTMIYVFVVGFGLFGLARLKIDLYPDISFPVIAIITTYTGVAPADMEMLVTKPRRGGGCLGGKYKAYSEPVQAGCVSGPGRI